MPLRKITDLTYETPPLGRIMGYGRFIIETAGQDQAFSRLEYIPDARRLYELLSHLTLHGTPPPESVDPTMGGDPLPKRSAQMARWVGHLFGGDYDE